MTITELVELIKTKRQIFLTGAAGTGKSYTTNLIKSRFSNVLTLASTNQAAILVGGDTVHSAFRLGRAKSLPELIAEDKRYVQWFCDNVINNPEKAMDTLKSKLFKLLSGTDLLIIDEISMISSSVFDLIYYRFEWCNAPIPPILLVGDLYQLPPVNKDTTDKSTIAIYNSKNFNPTIIELTKIKRTENIEFAKAQRTIRVGKYSESVHNILSEIQSQTLPKDFNPTILVSTNAKADHINASHLNKLKTEPKTYNAKVITDIKDKKAIDRIIKDMPVERELTLKVGARVMVTATSKEGGYYNGLQGIVKELNDTSVTIETDDGKEIELLPTSFEKNKVTMQSGSPEYLTELIIRQIPLRVCYAMTIHKSQGASIKQLEIDCERIFEKGMFYVAISRATDPKYIRLLNFNRKFVRNQVSLPRYLSDDTIRVPEIMDDALKLNLD